MKKEKSTQPHSSFKSSQDSVVSNNICDISRKIKCVSQSSLSSQPASQYLNDLSITRKRIDIAERIMLYSDNYKDALSQNNSDNATNTQESLSKELKALRNIV